MAGRVAGKTALVTGAAQGLGAAIAEALVREGARVALTDRNGDGAGEAARRINDRFGAGSAIGLRHDVTEEADWLAALAQTGDAFGGLSVLVNNAGIITMGSVEDLDLATWRQAMAVNSDAAFLGCKHALPLLRESQPAAIVNISSVAGLIASHNMAAYNVSKAAIWMLTRSVALHCARHGWDIRCNSVHPSFIDTPMLHGIAAGRDEAAIMAKLARQVPNGRIGQAADVAAAVIYLASDESAMTTGSELKLDGGLSAM